MNEFDNGAMNRRMGITKTQSAKHLKGRGPSDEFIANRAGWDAMDVYLRMKEIDAQTTEYEAAQR